MVIGHNPNHPQNTCDPYFLLLPNFINSPTQDVSLVFAGNWMADGIARENRPEGIVPGQLHPSNMIHVFRGRDTFLITILKLPSLIYNLSLILAFSLDFYPAFVIPSILFLSVAYYFPVFICTRQSSNAS